MTTETEGAAPADAEPVADSEVLETPEAGDDTGEDTPAATDEGDGGEQPAKPKKSAKERIDELTAARRQAERDAEFWREKALQQPQAPTPPAAAQKDEAEPDPSKYEYGETDARFIADRATFHATKAARAEFEQQRQIMAAQQAVQAFNARANTAFPDGEPVGIRNLRQMATNGLVPDAVGQIITHSEAGPQLANHLGSNPVELDRITRLPAHVQAYELAKIEARITAPQPKSVTTAPAPAPVTRGASGRFETAPDTDDFAAFQKQYGGSLAT